MLIKNIITNHLNSKINLYQSLFCAIFTTSIFSLRWSNCLPFSGDTPIFNSTDVLDSWARYLIWVREPLSFPLGVIKGMRFPFCDGVIGCNTLPLFAIPLKLLSKIYPSFSEFYFFISVELLFVFLVAFFSCSLLEIFKVRFFWLKLLGAALVSLSFPFLFRSSHYYGFTYLMAYFPLYISFAYYFIKMYIKPNFKSSALLIACLTCVAFFDEYTIFGIFFILTVSLCFCLFNFILNKNILNRGRLIFCIMSLGLGVLLSLSVTYSLGGRVDFTTTKNKSPLPGRYGDQWGYGGGSGGGFHVADLFTYIIPPEDNMHTPEYKRLGPISYLTKMGLPVRTTNDLQDGQYEGFTYLGTTTIGLLFLLSIIKLLSILKNYRIGLLKFRFKLSTKMFFVDQAFFSLPVILGVSAFFLYLLSLGYIIHMGGDRLNSICPPSLFIAIFSPKFIMARSLGRLAMPFMLFITFFTVILFNNYLSYHIYKSSTIKKFLIPLLLFSLVVIHINEIRGYLEPPSEVIHDSNEIVSFFNQKDGSLIRKFTKDKKAIIIAPEIRSNAEWLKTAYSLAFYSRIPISGIYYGIGIPAMYRRQTSNDISQILNGNIKKIFDRYGDVAIAVPIKRGPKIISQSNMPLNSFEFRNQDVIILTLDNQ